MAEVIANQLSSPNKIEFKKLQHLNVYVEKESSEKPVEYRATGFFIPKGFESRKISGSAIVARRLLSTICERLLDKDITKPAARAKKFLDILSKQPTIETAADPNKLKHFSQLKIDNDLEKLKKLSDNQPGAFSDFISGKQKF